MRYFILTVVVLLTFSPVSAQPWAEFKKEWDAIYQRDMAEILFLRDQQSITWKIDGINAWLNQEYEYYNHLKKELAKKPEEADVINEMIQKEKYKFEIYRLELKTLHRMQGEIAAGLPSRGESKQKYASKIAAKAANEFQAMQRYVKTINSIMSSKKKPLPAKKEGFMAWAKNSAMSFLTGVDYQEMEFRMNEFKISSKNKTSIIAYATLLNWGGTISNIGAPQFVEIAPDTSKITGQAAKLAILMGVKKQMVEDPEYPTDLVLKADAYVKSSLKLK